MFCFSLSIFIEYKYWYFLHSKSVPIRVHLRINASIWLKLSCKVEMDSIPSHFSESSNYWRESLLEVIRQNIAWRCQQTFFLKFVDNAQQCFAFITQVNFLGHNLNFVWSNVLHHHFYSPKVITQIQTGLEYSAG